MDEKESKFDRIVVSTRSRLEYNVTNLEEFDNYVHKLRDSLSWKREPSNETELVRYFYNHLKVVCNIKYRGDYFPISDFVRMGLKYYVALEIYDDQSVIYGNFPPSGTYCMDDTNFVEIIASRSLVI